MIPTIDGLKYDDTFTSLKYFIVTNNSGTNQNNDGILRKDTLDPVLNPTSTYSASVTLESLTVEEPVKKEGWGGKCDFFFSVIGYAVGLGNVWRFPYLCYKNGGGAFLLPYTLMLAIVGIPLFFFEMGIGQFSGLDTIKCWALCPLFKGVGWASIVVTIYVSIYYNVVFVWIFYYLFDSFRPEVAYKGCDHAWNDEKCQTNMNLSDKTDKSEAPTQQYWDRVVLGRTDYNGKTLYFEDGLGKVVYFTATFPYLMLFILLIRGCTLEGAMDGIKYYIKPQWGRLADSKVWCDAALQTFYSLGLSQGGLITMSTYNKFKHNFYKDAIIVACLDYFTSFVAGFAVFSVLGFLALKTNQKIEDVAQDGPGLAFIIYPAGISAMPVAPLWSILFFFMLLTLGLDSQFAFMATIFTCFSEQFPFLKATVYREYVGKTVMCFVFFLLGLPMCCQGGIYIFTVMDRFSAGFGLFVVCFCEIIAVCYCYGWRKYREDIWLMLGFKPGRYRYFNWLFLTPLVIVGIFIFSLVMYKRTSYGGYLLPSWAEAMGWFIVMSSVLMIPIFAMCEIRKHGSCKKAHKEEASWGPVHHKYWLDLDRYTRKITHRG